MNPKFLSSIPVVLHAPTHGDDSASGHSRRSFLKKTGGATVAALAVWTTQTLEASVSGSGSSSSEFRMTCNTPAYPTKENEVLQTFNQGTYPFRIVLDTTSAVSTMTPGGNYKDRNVTTMGSKTGGGGSFYTLKLQSKNGANWSDVINGSQNCDPERYFADVNTADGIITIDQGSGISVPASQSGSVQFTSITATRTANVTTQYDITVVIAYSWSFALPGVANNVTGSATMAVRTLHSIQSHPEIVDEPAE